MRQLRTIAALVVAVLLVGPRAQAFCRKTTCELTPTPLGCTQSTGSGYCIEDGLPLTWRTPCLSFSVQRDGSATSNISADVLEQEVRKAYDTWISVPCSEGGSPNLYVATYPQAACNLVGFQDGGPNQNLWVFRDAQWEQQIGAKGVIALTTLSVNEKTGEIFDADVELNSTDHVFTTGDDVVDTDLLSIVLHESGHVLGIDHTPWDTSTMSGSYNPRSIDKRSLETDDIDAICAIMPPGELPAACDPEPHGGFSTACQDPAQNGCCSVGRGRAGTGTLLSFGVVLLGLLGWRRHRAR